MPGFDATNSIVLFPAHLEFLHVQVQFHRTGVPGLKVRFYASDGAAVEDELISDLHGFVRAARRIPAGTYVCQVEHQPSTKVSTVLDPGTAYPVVLPVGRPYCDINERPEFVVPRPLARK